MKKQLSDFNSQAEKLLNSPFVKEVLLGEVKCSFSWEAGNGMEISSTDINENDLDAFILNLRFFVQNNEKISIGNLAKAYDESDFPQDLKDSVRVARNQLNDFLDSSMVFQWPDGADTYREHFNIIMYGALAHMNETKSELFQKWISDPFISHQVWTLFLMVLQNILATISYLRVVNQKALGEAN